MPDLLLLNPDKEQDISALMFGDIHTGEGSLNWSYVFGKFAEIAGNGVRGLGDFAGTLSDSLKEYLSTSGWVSDDLIYNLSSIQPMAINGWRDDWHDSIAPYGDISAIDLAIDMLVFSAGTFLASRLLRSNNVKAIAGVAGGLYGTLNTRLWRDELRGILADDGSSDPVAPLTNTSALTNELMQGIVTILGDLSDGLGNNQSSSIHMAGNKADELETLIRAGEVLAGG